MDQDAELDYYLPENKDGLVITTRVKCFSYRGSSSSGIFPIRLVETGDEFSIPASYQTYNYSIK